MTAYNPDDESELRRIRETIITAVASDDTLMERLVLKGGNALDIVYQLSQRASLDLDFSMGDDFESEADREATEERLFVALRNRFDALGYVVFDEKFESRPKKPGEINIVWGGYNAIFKLLTRKRFLELGGVPGVPPSGRLLEAMRREAQVTGIGAQRNFIIEIQSSSM